LDLALWVSSRVAVFAETEEVAFGAEGVREVEEGVHFVGAGVIGLDPVVEAGG
jgi:hypothetical protein